MKPLIDTNLLVRVTDSDDPQHENAKAALSALWDEGIQLHIVPQVLYEYRVVVTRPRENNGLGMSSDTAANATQEWMSMCHLLRDERSVFRQWQELVYDYRIVGRSCHDARLVAAMLRHGLDHIVTFNTNDFKRYKNISVIDPANI